MVNFWGNFCVVKICQSIDLHMVILDKWETFNDCFVLKLSKSVYLFDSPYTMEKTSEESVNVKK